MYIVDIFDEIVWFFQQFLVASAFVILCHGLSWQQLKKQGKTSKMVMEGIIIFVILAFPGMWLLSLPINSFFILFWGTVQGCVFAVYLRFFSGWRKTTKIILWCSMFAGLLTLTSLAGQMSYLMSGMGYVGRPEGAVRMAVYLLIPVLAVYLIRFNFNEFENLPVPGIALILSGDFILFLLVASESAWEIVDLNASKRFLAVYSCMLFMILIIVYALHSICSMQEERLILREEKQNLQKESERFYMAEEQMDEIRSIRHDLKNQRHYMKILLKEKRYDELEHYFAENESELPMPEAYVECTNKSVNIILNMEFAKMGDSIERETLLVVPPVLPFADDELCSMLTNLLDNAIEECRRIGEQGGRKPSIRLEIYPEANYLYIMCKNTTDRERLFHWKEGLRSTKEDQMQHGYGTRIVARIAEKYNGCVDYSVEEGYFIAKVMVDMTEVKKGERQR